MRNIVFYTLIVFTFFSCEKTEKNELPNIVLIMADDMGYECVGANGCTEYETPNLDRLAGSGLRFTNCYSQPLCTPSRVKIMTGKFNFRNYEDFGYLNPNQQTFGNLLKEAGYSTCIAGKWQLNGLNRNNPNNQDVERPHHFGFDEYCLWQLNRTRKEGERFANALVTQNGRDLPRDENNYGPQIFANYICDFIDRKAGQPFFVYYPMVLVHEPFVPTPDSPEWAAPERRYEKDTAYFADMMAFTDKVIGQIENKLKEKNCLENTLLIFTGDNGTHPTVYTTTSYAQVRGAKGQTINTGNHVPLIVSWPNRIKKNRVVEALVDFADVLPTLCDAANIDPEKYNTDGKSFLPLINGNEKAIQNEVFIHYTPRWGSWTKVHNRWVMDGKYKLYRDGRFYNTEIDTLEKNPLTRLSASEESIKKRFQEIIDKREKEMAFEKNNSSFKLEN